MLAYLIRLRGGLDLHVEQVLQFLEHHHCGVQDDRVAVLRTVLDQFHQRLERGKTKVRLCAVGSETGNQNKMALMDTSEFDEI